MTLSILGGDPVGSTDEHVKWPTYDHDDRAAVSRAIMCAPYGPGGPLIEEAEEAIADYFGARHALLVNSATDGLTAAQIAVGVRRGDEVIQPAYSFGATPQSTQAAGGRPKFVDIRPDTFTANPAEIAAAITKRTRAIMPVSMHGLIADVSAIQAIGNEHRIPVIWDNAQAAGGACGAYTAGTSGDVSVISGNYKKIWPFDQGGVVLTDDPAIDRALRCYAHYGTGPQGGALPSYWTQYHGVNLAPPNATAALAVARLPKLSGHLATAQRNMQALMDGLRGLPGLILPYVPSGTVTTWSRPRVGIDAEALGWKGTPRDLRDRVITALRGEGLPVRSWQEWPLPAHPAWRRDCPEAWSLMFARRPIPPEAWKPDAYPATVGLLEGSIMLAEDPYPLWDQPITVITDHYIPAICKVWDHMDAVMGADYEIQRPAPWPDES